MDKSVALGLGGLIQWQSHGVDSPTHVPTIYANIGVSIAHKKEEKELKDGFGPPCS